MKKISVILILVFALAFPGFAWGLVPPPGYTPPLAPLATPEAVISDANAYLQAMFGLDNYFDTGGFTDAQGHHPLQWNMTYNVSNPGVAPLNYPVLFYQKNDLGDLQWGVYQFLGQTKNNDTITDVRYPLNSSWGADTYLEDFSWVENPGDNGIMVNASGQTVWDWWFEYSGTKLQASVFDTYARSHPDYAAEIDKNIRVANSVQKRIEGGTFYWLSNSHADSAYWSSGSHPRWDAIQWHKYVHIIMPPGYNTWGAGIGFVLRNGNFGYKSFPIAPLGNSLIPDFLVEPTGKSWMYAFMTELAAIYEYQDGQATIDIPITVRNAGESGMTTLAADWQGNDLNSPRWSYDPATGWIDHTTAPGSAAAFNLAKEEARPTTITVPVPADDGQARLVIQANTGKIACPEENDFTNNTISILIRKQVFNLRAVAISTGTTNPQAGSTYTGGVRFRNDSSVGLTNVPIGVWVNGSRVTINGSSGYANFGPGEEKVFGFTYTLPSSGSAILEGVINVAPLTVAVEESNWEDNKVRITVAGASTEHGYDYGNSELRSLAHRQVSYLNYMGAGPLNREPNTAKWTDIVRTYLYPDRGKTIYNTVTNSSNLDYSKVIAPPKPGGDSSAPSYCTLTDWTITAATLNHPEQSDRFTFGHPVWEGERTTKDMILEGKRAKTNWKEMFSNAGTPIFDITAQAYIDGPTEYDLWANYTIRVTYTKVLATKVYTEDGSWYWKYTSYPNQTANYSYTGRGKILVNGTGAVPRAGAQAYDVFEVRPDLITDPNYEHYYEEG